MNGYYVMVCDYDGHTVLDWVYPSKEEAVSRAKEIQQDYTCVDSVIEYFHAASIYVGQLIGGRPQGKAVFNRVTR